MVEFVESTYDLHSHWNMLGLVECTYGPHDLWNMVELVECTYGPHDLWNMIELVECTFCPYGLKLYNTFLTQCPWNMVLLMNILFSVMVIGIW